MRFEEIEIGEVYEINYVDANYPCDCDCHKPGRNVRHIVACCHDMSYRGPAICESKNNQLRMITFAMKREVPCTHFVLYDTDVVRKMPAT